MGSYAEALPLHIKEPESCGPGHWTGGLVGIGPKEQEETRASPSALVKLARALEAALAQGMHFPTRAQAAMGPSGPRPRCIRT